LSVKKFFCSLLDLLQAHVTSNSKQITNFFKQIISAPIYIEYMTFAITRHPTPVLTTAAFKDCFGAEDGSSLPLDEQQLLRPVEMILFTHSKIELLENMNDSIWKIRTKEYPSKHPLYVDERFLTHVEPSFSERERPALSRKEILDRLNEQVGVRYIWGGNWPLGVPQMLHWYQPLAKCDTLSPLLLDTWQLKGVDCSGLLYFATEGSTPRNTSELVSWGESIEIENKPALAIVKELKPLDLIVWKGHVLIALNSHTLIESKAGAGVITHAAEERLSEILHTRRAVDKYDTSEPCFVIRRFYPTYTQGT
jgi:hypothetical protein